MRDVARLAGVSQRTVSNVVNHYIHVRAETRVRVEEAIQQLNYRPNVSARRLRSGRTGLVALAVPEIAVPYFAELADLIQQRAAELGLTLLIDQTGGVRERELLVLDGYHTNMIDGLILSPLAIKADDLRSRQLTFPTVLLGESVDNAGLIHVSIDNVAAATAATEHLIAIGRRRIAAIGAGFAPASIGPAPRRMRGYLLALSAAGLPAPVEVREPTGWSRAAGYAAAVELVERDCDVDALFCFNDLLALGAMKALADRGVRVPGDIAVIGWDDIEECRYATPELTSVVPDKAGIARTSVERLLPAAAGDESAEELTSTFTLAVRASTVGISRAPIADGDDSSTVTPTS